MSFDSNLQNLAIRTAVGDKSLRTLINGNAPDLTALATANKTSLVAAINETLATAGGGSGTGAGAPVWMSDSNINRTLVLGDAGNGISMLSDAYNFVIVPDHATAPIPINARIYVEMGGDGRTRIKPANSNVQVLCDVRYALLIAARYCVVELTKRSNNIWHVTGDLTLRADVPLPVIKTLTVSPTSIEAGESATLAWTSDGAVSAAILSPGIGSVSPSGSMTVTPSQPTTYTLSVSNEGGTTSQSISLAVTVPTGSVPPTIDSFTSNTSSVFPGNSARFDWETSNADTVTITPSPGLVSLDGFTFVVPTQTTTYTITATNAHGSDSRQITIGYGEAPPPAPTPTINSFTASPTSIQAGGLAQLDWAVTAADSVSINNGVGPVSSTGSVMVQPSVNTTYTLTATNTAGSTTATASVTIAASGSGGQIAGDIVNSSGAVVQQAYNDIGGNFSEPTKGLAYRYGPAATKTGVHTLTQRPDQPAPITYGSGVSIYYQFGTEDNNSFNDFITSDGWSLSRPPSNGTSVATAVRAFLTWAQDRRTTAQRPQARWQEGSSLQLPAIADYTQQGILSTTDAADLPIVMGHWCGPADSGCGRMAVGATQGSLTRGSRVFTMGTFTAKQQGSCTLAPGKVPTAIDFTSGAEFAFVTVWDLINFKGQVAIIALGGVPMGCTWQNTSNWYDWWHDWTDMCHPGLKNEGGWAFMKVIGYLDLPSSMKAPTHCFSNTGLHPYVPLYYMGQPAGIGQLGSPLASNRARFLDYNDLGQYVNRGGLLTIASKSEKTVCFIDLRPLFTYFNDMYFGSSASNLETQNLGMAPNQWPYLLSDHPTAMPTIIKTVTMPGKICGIRGTVAYNYWSKDWTRHEPNTPYMIPAPKSARTFIVTEENGGTCHIFSCGRWVIGGYQPDQTPVASEIAEIGSFSGLGEQITHVFGVKDYDVDPLGVVYEDGSGAPGCLDEMFGTTDRKNRRINWWQLSLNTGVNTSANTGFLAGSLEDSRLDVTEVDHVDGYNKSNKVILAADPTAGGVHTYRANSQYPFSPYGHPIPHA
ncbi:hypothetical protein H4CHR_02991 [Variovorax sp. PBS-H4]|uniref:hypothetical protein n=1 Tax=Variovorax sp. PBS-H4 TaxID=434008 RepID=UPI00131681B9|nr:hypothetical protein [Variovorax sp. PBS-H4]VTU32337.1 hypothetical protein H4CHR_02991 [Variovorax sp. PBS-H4]